MNSPADKPGQIGVGRRIFDAGSLFARGVAMGVADIIPGVSGGTIALISGIYERLIAALGSLSPAFVPPLVRGHGREAAKKLLAIHWLVLISVFGGVLVGGVSMSRVIPRLMEDSPGQTYAFFFGLILAAVWTPFALMRRRSASRFAIVAVAAAGAWLFVGIQPRGIMLEAVRAQPGAVSAVYPEKVRSIGDVRAAVDVARAALGDRLERIILLDPNGFVAEILGRTAPADDVYSDDAAAVLAELGRLNIIAFDSRDRIAEWSRLGEPSVVLAERRIALPIVFLFGVIAISAMILPGVSGAFLLLFLGQYHAILSAIHGVFEPVFALAGSASAAGIDARPWIDDAIFFCAFSLGALVGLVSFSRAIRWLLARAHDITMAALTGLMLGALRAPGAVVVREAVDAGDGYWSAVGFAALVGTVVVASLNVLDARLRSRRADASAAATPGDSAGDGDRSSNG